MWGGRQPGLPEVHDSEEKRAMCSVMEVCHLPSGRWEQKPTTGTPPLGVYGYAAAAIGNEIFYYGGYCGHPGCYHNSLFSFNVDTFNWKELSPTTPHHGPRMKWYCDMVAVQLDGEDYLVVIGGQGPPSRNTRKQPGAQYSGWICNEIHYYKLSSGQCIRVCVCALVDITSHIKLVCYLLHTAVQCMCNCNNKCVKFLIQHTKRAEITHYTLGQLFNTFQFCGRALLLR